MTKHKKHEDTFDVQVRTKILDMYGNPIEGAIEYDPVSGFGKRIVDPKLGIVADFFQKDGSVEIDGHNFDDSNYDDTKVKAVTDLVNLKVNRNDPTYEDQLQQHVKLNREADKDKNPGGKDKTGGDQPTITPEAPKKFRAKTQIAKGEEVLIDEETGDVTGTRSDNIFKPDSLLNQDDPQTRRISKHGTGTTPGF